MPHSRLVSLALAACFACACVFLAAFPCAHAQDEVAADEPADATKAADSAAETEAAAPTQAATAEVSVTSEPPGAAVSINGRRLGTTPFSIQMPVGATIELSLELAGYAAWTEEARTVENTGLEFAITLQAE